MSIEKLELPKLKEISTQKTLDVKETNLKMNDDIQQIIQIQKSKSPIHIQKSVIERYNKRFSQDKTRNALKNTIIVFTILFCVLLFFQPGLMPLINKPGITNLTGHSIDNIIISNLINQNEQTIQTSLQSQTSKEFKLEGGIYLVTAKRQLPTILIVPMAEKERIKNGLEQKIDEHNAGLQ
ncbi:MAG: hypothetical protein WC915_01300 [archaeon]|jgi:hypothetical protein